MISPVIPGHIRSENVDVSGSRIHYLESGAGDPVVFLHGNPTSSFLWRNVMPHLEGGRRCIAMDYIGMGASAKPASGYRLVDHLAYVEGFLEKLALENVTLVAHDWGVALGLSVCRRIPGRVRAIAFMEGHIHPIEQWSDFDPDSENMFKDLRSETKGRQLVIEENFFIEAILPGGTQRTLTEAEMDAYRAPFREKSAREPMLRWVNEIPIAGQPRDVHEIVVANQQYLAARNIPKLLLYAHPGAIIGANEVAWCMQHCPDLAAVDIGSGIHFVPEDQPDAIGRAIAQWLETLQ